MWRLRGLAGMGLAWERKERARRERRVVRRYFMVKVWNGLWRS